VAPGQTLTLRHDSIDRTSFMPGVVLACREVGGSTGSSSAWNTSSTDGPLPRALQARLGTAMRSRSRATMMSSPGAAAAASPTCPSRVG
jgi:hypothetical protein